MAGKDQESGAKQKLRSRPGSIRGCLKSWCVRAPRRPSNTTRRTRNSFPARQNLLIRSATASRSCFRKKRARWRKCGGLKTGTSVGAYGTMRNGSATGSFRGWGDAGKLSFARGADGDSG